MKQMDLGSRIKRVRGEKHLTLKAVEAAAGISATHISEIERGRTSPTIGVLLRIADALGVDPARFLEEEELDSVSAVRAEDRVRVSLPGSGGILEQLTTSIPAGRLQAVRLELNPGTSRHSAPHVHPGEEAALVTEGAVRFVVGQDTYLLQAGDSIHFDATVIHSFDNPSPDAAATLLWLSSERDVE